MHLTVNLAKYRCPSVTDFILNTAKRDWFLVFKTDQPSATAELLISLTKVNKVVLLFNTNVELNQHVMVSNQHGSTKLY